MGSSRGSSTGSSTQAKESSALQQTAKRRRRRKTNITHLAERRLLNALPWLHLAPKPVDISGAKTPLLEPQQQAAALPRDHQLRVQAGAQRGAGVEGASQVESSSRPWVAKQLQASPPAVHIRRARCCLRSVKAHCQGLTVKSLRACGRVILVVRPRSTPNGAQGSLATNGAIVA